MIKDDIRDAIKKGVLKEVHMTRPNIPGLKLSEFDKGMSAIVVALKKEIPEIRFDGNWTTERYVFTLPDDLPDDKKDRFIAIFAESKTVLAWHEWTF